MLFLYKLPKDFKSLLDQYQKEKILFIFYADWCHFCAENIPQVVRVLNQIEHKNPVIFIKVEESDNVWNETADDIIRINYVPTYRFYHQHKIIWEHEKPVKPNSLKKVFLKCYQ